MIDEALAGRSHSYSATPTTLSEQAEMEDNEDDAANDEGEDVDDDEHDDSRSLEWSRSPSPQRPNSRPRLEQGESTTSVGTDGGPGGDGQDQDQEDVDMNAADMAEEQDDYARFLSSIKNRDLNEVRTEIDDEIRILNGQNKVAMRDSDEISLAMVAQIQVSGDY